MKYNLLWVGLCVFLLVWGCSSADQPKKAVVSGTVTVADSIDSSNDYSGIGLTVIRRDSAGAVADTLFHALTDSDGNFSGTAEFENRNRYPMLVTRNQRTLGRFGVILADSDTIHITGQLPDLSRTLTIESREHNALKVYERIDKNYNRIAQFARAGILKGDSLRDELDKWSGMYWDVYQENKQTLAGKMSAAQSIRLLNGWKSEEMMSKIRSVQDDDELVDMAASYGKNYIAAERGLDAAVAYLDTLLNITDGREKKMQITMEQINLLYDSARVDQAKKKLTDFQSNFSDNKEAEEWAESISYDISYLSPGDTIPEFEFIDNGRTISRDSLIGTPYILEISTLSNSLYQEQFDRTVVIQSIYKNFGLEVVTLPLDDSQVTIDAFFEERVKAWPVSPAKTFDRQELLERFNVKLIPTRFLVNRKGKIVRKYVGREYQDVIKGIQTLINQENEPAS